MAITDKKTGPWGLDQVYNKINQGSIWAYAGDADEPGTLWGWGQNTNGELGQNSRTYFSSPKQVPGTTWAAVGGGRQGYHMVKNDGTLWAVGQNGSGFFGTNQSEGTIGRASSPVQIPGTTWNGSLGARGVTGGYEFAVALKSDGTLWSWGSNTDGKLGLTNTTAQ